METESYISIPVEPGGRDRSKVGCWGLVALIYKEQKGVLLPLHTEVNWRDSGEKAVVDTIAADEAELWREVAATERREYDVVVLRIKGVPWHVGVVVDSNRFIHAHPRAGVCVERLESLHWKSRVVCYQRLKDENDAGLART